MHKPANSCNSACALHWQTTTEYGCKLRVSKFSNNFRLICRCHITFLYPISLAIQQCLHKNKVQGHIDIIPIIVVMCSQHLRRYWQFAHHVPVIRSFFLWSSHMFSKSRGPVAPWGPCLVAHGLLHTTCLQPVLRWKLRELELEHPTFTNNEVENHHAMNGKTMENSLQILENHPFEWENSL